MVLTKHDKISGSFGFFWYPLLDCHGHMGRHTVLQSTFVSEPRKMVLMTWRTLTTALMKVWNMGTRYRVPLVGYGSKAQIQRIIYR